MILNKHPNQKKYGIRQMVDKKLNENQEKFTDYKDVSIGVITWNLGGNSPASNFDISNILLQDPTTGQLKSPDILIIAF